MKKNYYQKLFTHYNKNENKNRLKISETSENKSNSASDIIEINNKNEIGKQNSYFRQASVKNLVKIGNYLYQNSYINDENLAKIPKVTKTITSKKKTYNPKINSEKNLRVVKTYNFNNNKVN